MSQPKVNILLATYNGEKFLKTQLDSLIEQTYENIDIYVRDDCSTDNTVEFIKNYINTSRTAIYDYCFSQKVAGKYTTIYKIVRDGKPVYIKCQKHNRFYICKSGGGAITKAIVPDSDNIAYGDDISGIIVEEEKSLVADQRVALFNDYEYKEDYNLNYGFYINEAYKILYGNGKTGKGERRGINNNSNNLFGW